MYKYEKYMNDLWPTFVPIYQKFTLTGLSSPHFCTLIIITLNVCLFFYIVACQMSGLCQCCSWFWLYWQTLVYNFELWNWSVIICKFFIFYLQPMNQDLFKSPPLHQIEAARNISPSATSFATFRSTFPEHSPDICTQSQVKHFHYIKPHVWLHD